MSRVSDRDFADLLEKEATDLASFVLALVGDRHAAEDLYQSTCLELWRTRRRYRPDADFGAWARNAARYRILMYWRTSRRANVAFSSTAVDRVAEAYEGPSQGDDLSEMRKALATCFAALTADQQSVLRRRYDDGADIRTLARETGRTEGGMKMMLMRLRKKLSHCVRAKLARGASVHE